MKFLKSKFGVSVLLALIFIGSVLLIFAIPLFVTMIICWIASTFFNVYMPGLIKFIVYLGVLIVLLSIKNDN